MKKILVYLISALTAFMPVYVFASAAEDWTISENTYGNDRKSVHLEARKITQAAANRSVYRVDLPVRAAELGSSIKAMMWAGVAVAGVQAMLEGIGWIIDVGSKVIKRPVPVDPNPHSPSNSFYYALPYSGYSTIHFSTPDSACRGGYDMGLGDAVKATYPDYSHTDGTNCFLKRKDIDKFIVFANVQKHPNPNYDPSQAPTEPFEYLPDSALGDEVMGDGENATPLPAAIEQTYSPNNPVPAPAPDAARDALDNANPEPETQPQGETTPKPNADTDGDGVPDTVDPNSPPAGDTFELPAFCEWAPAVCDFFTVQKTDNTAIKDNQNKQLDQDKTFFEKVTDFFNWSKDDTELPPDETASITELPTPEITEDYISWGASCPADVQIPISLQGASSTLIFSWSPWCQLLDIIRPAIVASAYIGAAFIVLGLRT